VLQCVAVCCSVVQCLTNCELATYMGSQDDFQFRDGSYVDVLQCVAVCCSVMLCVSRTDNQSRVGSFVSVFQFVAA